jgi:hypothetical protein
MPRSAALAFAFAFASVFASMFALGACGARTVPVAPARDRIAIIA